jgi:hypothetical protein
VPQSCFRRIFALLIRTAPLLTALLFARPADAADKTWKYGGVNPNASTAGNWFAGVAPVAGDHVIFGSTTPTQPCNWDLAVTVSSVDFMGTYASTVSLSTDLLVSSSVVAAGSANAYLDLKGHQLSVGTSLTADGLVVASSVVGSSVTFAGAAYGVVSKSGGPLRVENAVFNKNAGASVTVVSDLITQGFSVLGGSATMSGMRLDLANDLFLNGYLDVQTSTLVLSGTIPQGLGGGGGAGITPLSGLYLQNPSTMTIPGLAVGVAIATRPASTVQFIAGNEFDVQSFFVQGGGVASRVRLVSDTPGTTATLNASSSTINLAFVQDIDASVGPSLLATHSIDGGDNTNWSILIGGGVLIWHYGGGSALASNAANWVGGAAPTAGDFVTFGSTTPTSPCTWDIASQVSSISVVGSYASTITLSTDLQSANGLNLSAPSAWVNLVNHALRSSGDVSVGSGHIYGVAGSSVSFEGANAAGLYSLTAGAVSIPGLSIAKTAGSTVTVQAPLVISHDFAVLTGTVAAGAFRHEVGGSLRVSGGYLDAHASTMSLSGSGLQSATFASASEVSSVGAFLAQSPSTTTFGAWSAGVFVATEPSSNLVFATGGSAFTVGSFTVDGQAPATRIGLSGPGALGVTVTGDVRYAYVSGLNASSGGTIPAEFSLDGGGNTNWNITNVGGFIRAWKYGGGTHLASNASNWAGGVAPSTGDYVVFGATTPTQPCTWDLSVELSSFSINSPFASVVTLSTDLVVLEGLRLDSPTGSLDPAGQRIFDAGDWAVLPGAFSGGVAQSTVTFFGTLSSDLYSVGAGPLVFGRLEIGKDSSADAWILSDLVVDADFETLGGNIDGGSNRLDVFGDVQIDGGAFDASLSTLVFSGSSPQATTGNGNGTVGSIAAIYMQNPTTTTILDVMADVFIATRPSSTIAFGTTGGNPTFGDFTVNGQSPATRIRLVSATPGSANPLQVTGAASIDYAFVQDLDASPGQTLTALHSIDGGDDTNWSISSVGGVSHVWRYGGGTALASNAANWTTGLVPSTGDYVLFGSSTPAAPCTWDLTVAVASVSIGGAYASSVTLATDMTVSAGVRFDAPLATLNAAGHSIFDYGDWFGGATGVISTVAGSSAVFVGGSTSRLISDVPAPMGFQTLVTSKTAGVAVVAMADVVTERDFIMMSGTFSAAGVTLNMHHDLVSDGGYLDVSQTTVAFSGVASAEQLTGNGVGEATNFRVLAIQTTLDVTIPGISADIFIATRPNASVLFATQGSPFTVTAMHIDGGSPSTRVRLQSTQPGVAAKLAVLSTATVVEASVKDIDATSGIGVVAVNTLDLGNNSSWTFLTNGQGIQQAIVQEVDLSSATLKWFTSFPNGQSYLAQLSTGAFPNAFAGNQSSTTVNTTATFFGLTPNTQYFGQVSTGAFAVFSTAGATVTLAALPSSFAITGVFQSSVTASWSANGNPSPTRFDFVASTDAFATITFDSATLATTAVDAGLASNATYYLAVSATNSGGVVTLPGTFLTTVTVVAPPGTAAPAVVSSYSVTASWSSGGDYPGTYFDAQISTNGYGTLVASTRTTALSAFFGPLTASTTYQLRVRALSNGGTTTAFVELSTAVTQLASPGAAATAFPAVGVSSVSVQWTSGGNGGGTVYVADLSTDSFATLVYSSSTQSLSAVFGTGGAGPALTPNLVYFARVSATSGGNASAYLQIGSTATLPAPPTGAAALDIETSSGTWSWSAAGNGAGTVYGVQLSTDAYATFVQTASVTTTSAAFSGLTPNTTYQFRVRVFGVGGSTTAFSAAVSSATMPSAPSGLAPSVFVSSMHAVWADSDPGTLRYSAEASSDSFATLTVTSFTANAFADLTGLAGNTTYFLRVRALGVSGAWAASAPLSTATLASPPGAPSFTATGLTQASVAWTSGGNPGGTLYRADLSTDSFLTLVQSSSTVGLTASFSGLASDTTHFLRVSALNVAGSPSSFSSGGSTTTVVAPPAAAPLSGVGASDVIVNWGAGTNGPGTVYETQVTTGIFPVFNASARTAALSYDFSGLSVNTTYAFQVRAVGRGGVLTSFVALGTTQTLLLTPGVPAQTFSTVGVSSVAVVWTSGGNGAGVLYDADLSTDNFATVSLTSATAGLTAVFGAGGLGAPLASDSTFYFRVRADGGSTQSAYAGLGSTVTAAAPPVSPQTAAATPTSVTFAWSANGNAPTTVYLAQISSTSFVSVEASSQAAFLSAVFSGLIPDATYQLRARAVGITGPSAFVSVSTWTQPAAPTAVAATALGASSVTVTWTASDAAGTPYLVQITSTSFPQVYAASTTAGSPAQFTGLPANTTFFAEVAALAPDGTGPGPVTSTAAATPAVAPPSVSPAGVSVASGTWTWALGSNGPTLYGVDLSTMAGFVPLAQTTTVFASSVPGASVFFTGLLPNTTHYVRVRAAGWTGPTAYTLAAGSATAAAAPVSLPPLAVGVNSATVTWGANGNPGGTVYEADVSTDGFVSYNSTAVVTLTQAGFSGLAANTAYYFRARALGLTGPSAFVALPSTWTTPAVPGAPAAPFTAVGTSSVAVSWTNSGNGAGTLYAADVSTDAFVTLVVSSLTANLSATFGTGGVGVLSPDTTYQFRVAASSGSSFSAEVPLGSTATLAAAPVAPAATGVSTGSVSAAWSANGNPNGALYQVQLSTDSFATLVNTAAVQTATAAFGGLTPDSTYYLRVRAVGRDGRATAFVAAASTATNAAAPSIGLTTTTATTATLAWTSGGDPATTVYDAQVSTDAFATLVQSSQTSVTQVTFSGLQSDTTVYLRVRALGIDGPTAYATAATTATSAALPGTPAAAALGVSSVTISWTASGNSAGTVYLAQLSTDSFATFVQSSATANLSATFTGLQANATYYQRVRADQWNGFFSLFATPASTTTPVALPASAPLVSVGTGSIVAAWSSGGNQAATLYDAQLSTDSFATTNATVRVAALSAGFGGLQSNAAYQLQVRAVGNDGTVTAFVSLPSTTTFIASPGVPAAPLSGVGVSSVTASWTSGGNGGGTVYRADVSSDSFATLVVSSLTANLSALFGTGGQGILRPDTTFQFRVFATFGPSLSAAAPLGSTTTLPANPAAPAASASSTSTLTLSWTANGNPADTAYLAALSTDSFATVTQSSAVKTTAAAFSLLLPDTTYYLRVRASGRGGAVGGFIAAPSTATVAAAPTGAVATLGLSSATLSWSTAGDPASTVFDAQLSTDAFATVTVSSQPHGGLAIFPGLLPNTTYYTRVRALGLLGPTAFSTPAAAATTPAAPSSPASAVLGVSSVSLSWSSNADPAGTIYLAAVSTDSFATVVQSSATANLSATFAGLTPNTTYFLRVQATGWSGAVSTFALAAATATAPAVPAAGSLGPVTSSSVFVTWGANGDPAGTVYEAQASTDAFATLVQSSVTVALGASFGSLTPATTYQFQVRALGVGGSPSAFVALGSTQTFLLTPGAAATPFPAVGVSSVTVAWTSGGNAPGTAYRAQSSTNAFATVVFSSDTQNLTAYFGTGGAGAPLSPDAIYQFRVFAVSTGVTSGTLVIGSTGTLAFDPGAPAASGSTPNTLTLSWTANGNPSDTLYQARLSTDAFVTVSQSSAVNANSATFSGLAPDTTYYLQARAVSRAGAADAYIAAPTTATVAATPAAPIAAFATTTATLTWSTAGDPATTVFDAQLSTDAFATVSLSSQPKGGAAAFAGLASNTTYYLRVRALGLDGPTAFATASAGATGAAAPGSPQAAALGVSSVSVSWTAAGNAAGTVYDAEVSTDSFATLVQSSGTANLTASFAGLQANGTYYLRVRAAQWNGGFSAYASAGSTTTPVAPPVSAPLVSVGTGSIVAAWTSGGDAAGTLYDAQLSTDSFVTIVQSARVAALTAGFGGLASNTAYQLRARAVGDDGTLTAFVALPSTTTALLPPAAAAVPFPAVGVSSVTAAWASGGNGPGTIYRAQLSTDAFVTVVVASDTQNLSAYFGSGGAGAPLSPDTTYQARVLTVNGGTQSTILVIGSTGTLAFDPGAPAASASATNSLTLSWTANGNPSDTLYQARLSTDAFATVSQSSAVNATSTSFSGLVPDTTYYLQARAVSRAGAADAYIAAPTTATVAATPAAPVASFATTTATVTWSTAGDPATTVFDAQISTDVFATLVQSSQSKGGAASYAGLTPNTTYFLRVRALGLLGPTAFVTASTGATGPAAPSAASAAALGVSSVSVSWAANGDPSGTVYGAEVSTDAFATLVQSSATANLAAAFVGLQANATYFLRVRADGWNGSFSAYASAGTTTTPVAQPVSAPLVSVVTGTIVAAWTSGGNAVGTLYDAQLSTDAFATVNQTARLAALQASFGGLLSNTAYDLRVRAIGNDGTLTAFVALPSTTTALLPPAAAAVPFPAVGVSSVTMAWTSGGNGPGTIYRAQLSTDAFNTVVGSSDTQNLSAYFGTGGAGAPLSPDATYQARVFTVNGGNSSGFVVIGTTGTLAFDPAAPAASASSTTALTLSWSANGNPSDTAYLARLSTNAFVSVSQSSAVTSTSATFSGLIPDTTYYLKVRSASRAGVTGVFVLAPATATVAATPAAPVAAFALNGATLTWSAAGDPATTVYDAQISTDAFATLVQSSQPKGGAASYSGLTPNTTYFLRVRALGLLGPTAFVTASTGATNAAAPLAASAAALGVSSASASWSSGGNPAGTVYGADISTDSFATLVQSSATANLAAAFTGLQANATYFLRVRADGWNGSFSAYAAAGSTTTPVALPVTAPLVSVVTGTIVAAWSSGGNAAGTLYDAQISTDAFVSVNRTARAAALQASFGGLLSNTAYNLRVRAIGDDGTLTAFVALPSTTTALLPPGTAANTFPAIGVSSLTVAWTSGGNGPGTVYRSQLSTDAFVTLVVSSDTQNLSALFGTGGVGALSVNTLYAARVLTVNGPNQSPLVPLGSTSTLAMAPTGTALVAVTSQTVTLDWSANGNPEPGTSYQVDRSLTAGFAAPARVTVSTSGATLSGLTMNTTYYFRVRAVSASGAATTFDTALSTATLPPAPGQPGAPVPTTLGVSSISWTWTPAALAVGYKLYSDAAGTVLLNSQSSATFVESSLGPNASAYLVAVGINGSGPGPNSPVGLGWTYANAPTGSVASAVFATSATLTWGLNGNPAYTGAQVQRSLDNVTYAVAAATAASVTYTDQNLLGCTTYYYRVRNFDGASRATAFDSTVTFFTVASTPLAASALTAQPLTGFKVALGWSPSPSVDVVSYRLYSDGGTGTVNFAAPYATLVSSAVAFTTPPLVSSAAYTFVLRATNHCGVEEKNVSTRAQAPAVATPAAVTTVVSSPPGGHHISGNRIAVSAALSNGQLTALSSVRFQYRASGAGAWLDVPAATPGHPNPAFIAPYYTQWDVTALAPGAYDLRALAYDLSGSSDPAPSAATVSVDPVAPDLSANDIGGGFVRTDEAVFASVDNAVIAVGVNAGDPLARLVLPAGALVTSTATLSLISNPDVTAVSTSVAGAPGAGLYASVTLSNAQTQLSGGRTALLTLSYPDANNDGIVDGSGISASALKFYSYNTISASWVPDLTTTFDPAARTVTGATPHFTLFGLFAPAAGTTTLDAVRVYPVPYRPNGNNPDEGRPYAAGVAGTGIFFDSLPTNARIQIYTIDGRLVVELNANGASSIQWDARNGAGRDVATGGYFAVVSAPGLRSVVKRLSIIR